MELAQELARQEGCSLFTVMSRAERYPELKRAAPKMKLFTQMIEELRAFSENNSPDALYDELLEKTGYLRMLESSEDDKDQARAENVRELKSSILGFMKESGDTTLDGYLANVALYTDLDNYDRDADSVVMMTMHSAKGLEFPAVFLIGMEESIFPGIRAIGEPEEMEEERRLCYVALTRAKRRLYLVCARQRMLFGRTTANRASRFVDEIPEEHIRKNLPRGYSYHDRREELGFVSRERRDEPNYPYRPAAAKPRTVPAPRPRPAAEADLRFSPGDAVRHKAFGDGVIVKMTPRGNDFLVEIQFEKIGLKKLMLRAAALHMSKR